MMVACRLDYDEYVELEWTSYLAREPDGVCQISKADYLRSFMRANQGIINIFDSLDRGHKGFLTNEDVRAGSRGNFALSDRGKKGYLVCEDLLRDCPTRSQGPPALSPGSASPSPADDSSVKMCPDTSAARVVRAVRSAIAADAKAREPKMRQFLADHRWEYFDVDHDDRLDPDEYVEYRWADFLLRLPNEPCVISKTDWLLANYLSFFSAYQQQKETVKLLEQFERLDSGKKGYLNKNDLAKYFRSEYHIALSRKPR